MTATTRTRLSFEPLAGALGAQVHGIDLARLPDAASVAAIAEALRRYHVLVFRGQPLLTVEQHAALAACFGLLESTPFGTEGQHPALLMLDQRGEDPNQAAHFHADGTFHEHPPRGALLQAHVLPERGGDTCFASMHAAFEALSPRLQALLDGLEAFHSVAQVAARGNGPVGDGAGEAGSGCMMRAGFALAQFPPRRQPVIARHPETGRRYLNVNYNYTTHIDGLPPAESTALLAYLYSHVVRPEFQLRVRWGVGDLVYWDNRATQHCAVADYTGRRVMQRIGLAGGPGAMPATQGE